MAIADLAEFRTALTAQAEILSLNVGTATVIIGRHYDLWVPSIPAGVAPTASVAPTRATQGALGQQNGGSGQLGILAARFNTLAPGTYIIADRLVHSGGLAGNVATAQTTNLPSTALTRYTDGVGVMMGLTIYAAIGATATTVTAAYQSTTSAAGARTSPAVAIGGTGFNAANRMIMLPTQDDDLGVRSVSSVTLAATTGTAGNFGVTLFKPLCVICVESTHGVAAVGFLSGGFMGGLPEIVDDACLFPICISAGTSGAASAALVIEEF